MDKVEEEKKEEVSDRCALIAKVIHGYFNTSIGFALVKWFPLTYSSAMRQMTAFFAFPLAICFLGEYPSGRQILVMSLIVSFYMGFVFTADSD